jgi:hypothetical protein
MPLHCALALLVLVDFITFGLSDDDGDEQMLHLPFPELQYAQ